MPRERLQQPRPLLLEALQPRHQWTRLTAEHDRLVSFPIWCCSTPSSSGTSGVFESALAPSDPFPAQGGDRLFDQIRRQHVVMQRLQHRGVGEPRRHLHPVGADHPPFLRDG